MEDLSLHILDIVENATTAGATRVEITIREDSKKDELTIRIRDNGRGMTPELLRKVRDPFTTTRTTRRVGLGVPLLEQSAVETGGGLDIASAPGQGTDLTARFRVSHIDRRPLGDLGSTLVTLILGNPNVDFVLEWDRDGEKTEVDTREIRRELDGAPITDPEVLNLIRDLFKEK